MSHRCLTEDDLQMPYQKMSCRCVIDDLQMSYQKMPCMRCLKDVLYNLTMLYIISNLSIKTAWHGYIFPKYYSYVSLIISKLFLAAAQSKHWVKNLSLYNLMATKMIDELEITYMCLFAHHIVIMELDTKKKLRRKIWTWEWLLRRNKRGAYNEILNKLRLNKF